MRDLEAGTVRSKDTKDSEKEHGAEIISGVHNPLIFAKLSMNPQRPETESYVHALNSIISAIENDRIVTRRAFETQVQQLDFLSAGHQNVWQREAGNWYTHDLKHPHAVLKKHNYREVEHIKEFGSDGLCLHIFPDGRVISAGSGGIIKIWEKSGHTWTYELLKGHSSRVDVIKALSSHRIISASRDGSIRMWDKRGNTWSSTEIIKLGIVFQCPRNPYVFNISSLQLLPSGKLCIGDSKGVVHFWDVEGKAWDVENPRLVESDENIEVSSGSRDPVISSIEILSNDCIIVASDSVYACTRNPEGKWSALKISHNDLYEERFGYKVRLCQVQHVHSPDGNRIVAAGSGHISYYPNSDKVEIFSKNGLVDILPRIEDGITDLQMLPDGRIIIASDTHNNLRIWNKQEDKWTSEILQYQHFDASVRGFRVLPDGRIISDCSDGIHIWDGDPVK